MGSLIRSWASLGLLLALGACADRASTGGGSGGGGSDTAATDSGPDTMESADAADTTASPDTTATTTTADPPDCDAYVSDYSGGFHFRIRNERDEAVVLGNPVACQTSRFAVDSPLGSWSGPHCTLECEDVMNGYCVCADDCPGAIGLRIEPGGQRDLIWSGRVKAPQELPAGCAGEGCGTSCNILRAVPEGEAALVTLGLVDTEACGDSCICDANLEGWCDVTEWNGSITPVQFEFVHGESGALVLE